MAPLVYVCFLVHKEESVFILAERIKSRSDKMFYSSDSVCPIVLEIAYDYQPLIARLFVPLSQITATAAMTVRDQRDYGGGTNGIYNNENMVPSTC